VIIAVYFCLNSNPSPFTQTFCTSFFPLSANYTQFSYNSTTLLLSASYFTVTADKDHTLLHLCGCLYNHWILYTTMTVQCVRLAFIPATSSSCSSTHRRHRITVVLFCGHISTDKSFIHEAFLIAELYVMHSDEGLCSLWLCASLVIRRRVFFRLWFMIASPYIPCAIMSK